MDVQSVLPGLVPIFCEFWIPLLRINLFVTNIYTVFTADQRKV